MVADGRLRNRYKQPRMASVPPTFGAGQRNTRGVVGADLRRTIIEAAVVTNASNVPAFANSASSSSRKNPAANATKIPVTAVINIGVPVRGDTALNRLGSKPSRAITKKMRLWPYIITRITEGNAISAASPTAQAA